MENNLVVKFKHNPEYYFKMPELADEGCSGYDVFASLWDKPQKFINLSPGQRTIIGLNLYLEIPNGYECQVRSKSGLALKNGIRVHPGTVDASYRGMVSCIIFNNGQETFRIEEGMKIAQLVFQKVEHPQLVEVLEISETSRGEGGFGSTGLK